MIQIIYVCVVLLGSCSIFNGLSLYLYTHKDVPYIDGDYSSLVVKEDFLVVVGRNTYEAVILTGTKPEDGE